MKKLSLQLSHCALQQLEHFPVMILVALQYIAVHGLMLICNKCLHEETVPSTTPLTIHLCNDFSSITTVVHGLMTNNIAYYRHHTYPYYR